MSSTASLKGKFRLWTITLTLRDQEKKSKKTSVEELYIALLKEAKKLSLLMGRLSVYTVALFRKIEKIRKKLSLLAGKLSVYTVALFRKIGKKN